MDPWEASVTSSGVALTVNDTVWPPSFGSTAILLVQVPADGQSAALRALTSTLAVTAFPDSPTNKAKRDDTNGINLVMHTLPMTRAEASLIELVGSGTFAAVCRWLPITEAGD
jgi:hypothetical protein